MLILTPRCFLRRGHRRAAEVQEPVIFVLSSAILLHYTRPFLPSHSSSQARRRRAEDAEPAQRGTALRSEGRMLFVGLTAAMGLAAFAYLALAVYLTVLICMKVVSSCLSPQLRVGEPPSQYGSDPRRRLTEEPDQEPA